MTTIAHPIPTRYSTAVFAGKAALLQLRRAGADLASGQRRWVVGDAGEYPAVVAESIWPLWGETSAYEVPLQWGKVQNLRVAVRRLDGVVVPAGRVFSFWKQIGRAAARRGFVPGRLLREGCFLPAVGGGLCQLSNALYDAALKANCEIVERHGHSQVVPGSAAEIGRDATVAWNYIDLRFRWDHPFLIDAKLTRNELIVRFRSAGETPQASSQPTSRVLLNLIDDAHSCASCGATSCFRHMPVMLPVREAAGATAFLMHERWPEFERYIAEHRRHEDTLGVPLDGARWRQPRYAWNTSGFARVATAAPVVWRHRVSARSAKGGARLEAQLAADSEIAIALGRQLEPNVTHLVVAQSLLPHLWGEGYLGGRSFDVTMTRLPLPQLQERLDAAAAAYPERATLKEFRAPNWLVRAEEDALAHAARIVTPHAEIAALFGERANRVGWEVGRALPMGRCTSHDELIIGFPGPTAARKGAYELREAARRVGGVRVAAFGSELEGDDFWGELAAPGSPRAVHAVVQPALLEDQPRALLTALAMGIPAAATTHCGIEARPGLIVVSFGDVAALAAALMRLRDSVD